MYTVLVTGATDRLGRLIAEHLAVQHKIIIHYNTASEKALALSEQLNAEIWQADLTAKFLNVPPCDILINNAAIFQQDTIESISDSSFLKHMQLNCLAPIKLAQKTKASQIINILDAKIKRQSPGFLSYSLSKAALAAFTEIAALELAPHTRVNAIAPGPVIPAPTQRQQHFDEMRQRAPLAKTVGGARITDVLIAIDYLISAKSVTGQTLYVDAGATVGNGGFLPAC